MQVEFRGDIEGMIRHCLKEMDRSGLRRELKLKAIPKPSMRRKEKERLNAQRRRKHERKRVAMDVRNRRSDYDYIRRQDQTGGQINLRRSLATDRSQ